MKAERYTDAVYKTSSPYVQAVEVTGKLLFTSGYLGRDKTGKIVEKGNVAAQTRQCLENIRLSIEAAGGSLKDLVRLNVVIVHARLYDEMNAVRKEMLDGIAFTSVTTVAQLIDPHGLVEIDAIAAIGSSKGG
jgi:2-iminobutanoate/2-iminopropanoate deaminase